MTPRLSIGREAAISFGINAVLSLAFFLATFGFASRPLAWGAPDRLAIDFLPQSIAVTLMSGLVPALIARRRLGSAIALRPILLRAGLFTLAGAALGALLAFAASALTVPVSWPSAVAIKLTYGGTLGALVTCVALRSMALPWSPRPAVRHSNFVTPGLTRGPASSGAMTEEKRESRVTPGVTP